MLTDKSDFCADGSNKTTKMEWSGEVCEGGKIKWNSMKSLAGTTRPDKAAGCSWNREGKSDMDNKISRKLWVSPTYVSLPTTVTELQSKKGSIVSGKCALEYCNTYPDLKKAFCDDKEYTTKITSRKLYESGLHME